MLKDLEYNICEKSGSETRPNRNLEMKIKYISTVTSICYIVIYWTAERIFSRYTFLES